MAEHNTDEMLAAAARCGLDQLLDEWAEHVCMCLEQKENRMAHVCIIDEDLGYDWWHRLLIRLPFNAASPFLPPYYEPAASWVKFCSIIN